MYKRFFSIFFLFVVFGYFLFFGAIKIVNGQCCACNLSADIYGNCNVGNGACAYLCCDPNAWTTCTVNCGGGSQVNGCGTPRACNTQACPAWIKLKNSSFASPNSLTNMIALSPIAYDVDDTTEQFFVVDKDGVVAAPAININISNASPTAKTGDPEYKVLYTPSAYSMTSTSFLSYVKARKSDYEVITDLNQIATSGIYIYEGDITIDSDVAPFDEAYNIVLVVTGTVTVAPASDNTFTPVGSVAVVASTINFNNTVTEAQGIFIASNISTGTNATQGLKVIGNLIAQASFSNNREWATTSKPSLFIVFDQTQYIDLLPYLSTASYQWSQTQ